jgi:hypothetical protein
MSNSLTPEYERVRRQLRELRDPLLTLHKTLVDSERIFYEKTLGPIRSPRHFLELLAHDPWFVWLQPLSQLIVAIDMVLDAKTPPPAAVLETLVRQSFGLLAPTETAGDLDDRGFARHYFEALQRDPEVVVAHGEVIRLRRVRPAP